MSRFLQKDFLFELFKISIESKYYMGLLIDHMQFEYLPSEAFKKLFKHVKYNFALHGRQLPTYGGLTQEFEKDEEVVKILFDINQCDVRDRHYSIAQDFEGWLRHTKFIHTHTTETEEYQKATSAEDRDRALGRFYRKMEQAISFSMVKKDYEGVYNNFTERQIYRSKLAEEGNSNKIATGINELDYYLGGGLIRKQSCLLMGRSGAGKSTMMRWLSIQAFARKKNVVYFSFEGSKEQTMLLFDAAWTGTPIAKMAMGELDHNKREAVYSTAKKMAGGGGDITVISSNSFDEVTIDSCRRILIDIERQIGKIDLVCFDYLELLQTGETYTKKHSGKDERERRKHLAEMITDISKDLDCATVTATQSNNVMPAIYNNPDFVLTRDNISDAKNVLYPFSYFITINATSDEYSNQVARLHIDKFREGKSGQTMNICQSLHLGRFYDGDKTCKLFWDSVINEKRQIQQVEE